MKGVEVAEDGGEESLGERGGAHVVPRLIKQVRGLLKGP